MMEMSDELKEKMMRVFGAPREEIFENEDGRYPENFAMEDYSDEAMKFWQGGFISDPFMINSKIHMPMMINAMYGLDGEVGEASEIVKKYLFQGHEIDYDHLAKELGDVCWYLNLAARALGLDIGDLMNLNLDKLYARYPEGHFSQERTLHRKEGDI